MYAQVCMKENVTTRGPSRNFNLCSSCIFRQVNKQVMETRSSVYSRDHLSETKCYVFLEYSQRGCLADVFPCCKQAALFVLFPCASNKAPGTSNCKSNYRLTFCVLDSVNKLKTCVFIFSACEYQFNAHKQMWLWSEVYFTQPMS